MIHAPGESMSTGCINFGALYDDFVCGDVYNCCAYHVTYVFQIVDNTFRYVQPMKMIRYGKAPTVWGEDDWCLEPGEYLTIAVEKNRCRDPYMVWVIKYVFLSNSKRHFSVIGIIYTDNISDNPQDVLNMVLKRLQASSTT